MNFYENYENEKPEVHEDFEMGTVCNAFGYSVNMFGRKVNVWLLLLIIIVLVIALFYRKNKRFPTSACDLTNSFTSQTSPGLANIRGGMLDTQTQAGRFFSNMFDTPQFIRNLN